MLYCRCRWQIVSVCCALHAPSALKCPICHALLNRAAQMCAHPGCLSLLTQNTPATMVPMLLQSKRRGWAPLLRQEWVGCVLSQLCGELLSKLEGRALSSRHGELLLLLTHSASTSAWTEGIAGCTAVSAMVSCSVSYDLYPCDDSRRQGSGKWRTCVSAGGHLATPC